MRAASSTTGLIPAARLTPGRSPPPARRPSWGSTRALPRHHLLPAAPRPLKGAQRISIFLIVSLLVVSSVFAVTATTRRSNDR